MRIQWHLRSCTLLSDHHIMPFGRHRTSKLCYMEASNVAILCRIVQSARKIALTNCYIIKTFAATLGLPSCFTPLHPA